MTRKTDTTGFQKPPNWQNGWSLGPSGGEEAPVTSLRTRDSPTYWRTDFVHTPIGHSCRRVSWSRRLSRCAACSSPGASSAHRRPCRLGRLGQHGRPHRGGQGRRRPEHDRAPTRLVQLRRHHRRPRSAAWPQLRGASAAAIDPASRQPRLKVRRRDASRLVQLREGSTTYTGSRSRSSTRGRLEGRTDGHHRQQGQYRTCRRRTSWTSGCFGPQGVYQGSFQPYKVSTGTASRPSAQGARWDVVPA